MRVFFAIGILAATVAASLPAFAGEATLAPADESFGRFSLSVLGIANAIRDSGARIDAGVQARTLITGPLAFATDALHAWEARYPGDPWIAKDLLALENVYLKIQTGDAFALASKTEAWLAADFPQSSYVVRARSMLAGATRTAPASAPAPAAIAAPPQSAWDRFASLRVPATH